MKFWRCRLCGVFAAVIFLGVGCMEVNNECDVRAQDEGGSEISCPGVKAITTDSTLPDEARCHVGGDKISCTSGERFDVPGEESDAGNDGGEMGDGVDVELNDGRDSAQADDNPEVPGGYGAGSTAGAWETSCVVVAAHATCTDGARANVGEASECVSRMIPGVGRRIICADGVERTPDNGSVDGVNATCTKYAQSITCSDGTSVILDEDESFSDENCETEIERIGNEVVVTCGEDEWRFGVADECSGNYFIGNDEDVQDFFARECVRWWGDLIIKKSTLETLSFMVYVSYISGSLRIVDNAHLRRFSFPNLLGVGGDLVVQGNPELEWIGEWPRLYGVGGSVQFSNNQNVHSIESKPSTLVRGSWSITGHQKLTFIGFPRVNVTPRRFSLPAVKIEGAFLFFDNVMWGACRERIVWLWALDHADMVYIGNSGGWLHDEQWCENFVW